jgi:hypothetical protein
MILEVAASAVISAGALALPSRAQSQTAKYIADQTYTSLNHLHNSIVFGTRKTFEELRSIFEEGQTDNWDGYNALPISKETLLHAESFLKALPLGTKAPSIGAEPDGHLTLEWYQSPRRTLSISVSPDGTLYYAALFGSSRVHGSEPFVGKVPENIMSIIKRVHAA